MPNKRNILLTTHQFLPDFSGGTEVLTYQSAKELLARGHRVTVLAGHPGPLDLPHDQRFVRTSHDGIPVIRYLHAHFTSPLQTNIVEAEYYSRHFATLVRPILENLAPDVVHFFHLNRLSTSLIDVCDELNLPMVFTPTDFWPLCVTSQLRLPDHSLCSGPDAHAINCVRHYVQMTQTPEVQSQVAAMSDRKVEVLIRGDRRHKFEKQWFRGFPRAVAGRPRTIMDRLNRVQRVLAPTQVMYDLLRQHGLEEIRACKSAYGVSVTNIPRNTDRGRNPTLRVGFIGQLVEHKAPHLLIEAVTSLPPHLNIAADIYGDLSQDPPYAARLQTLANNNPRIRFAGTFPNSKIGEIFSTFDVFVVPSIWYENTPLVIYNSLAAGCPLVVTNLGGMAEPVPAGIAGLHFDRGNVPQLAAHLHRLHDDRPFLRRLAEGTKLPKTIPEYVDELHGHYAFARVMKTGKSF